MTRGRPGSTLFPYTTLFRSGGNRPRGRGTTPGESGPTPSRYRAPRLAARATRCGRSEEHTSELQSRRDLVCRLLLEKKKRDAGRDAPPKPEARKRSQPPAER